MSAPKAANSLQSIVYKDGHLSILDQLKLPHESVYFDINTAEEGAEAIRLMKVRGAPAIAIVAALSVAVEIYKLLKLSTGANANTPPELLTNAAFTKYLRDRLAIVLKARPTAVHVRNAVDELNALAKREALNRKPTELAKCVVARMEEMLCEDLEMNKKMGRLGAEHILANCQPSRAAERTESSGRMCVLTHCNTGSLATAGYGTALGVIRALHERDALERVYFTETRPYMQGARLTAYELAHENIPATLICDNMVALLLARGPHTVSAVVTGGDRVAANGDSANKIGTMQLAMIAKHYGVPFYIAVASTSIDPKTPTGAHIVIEERPSHELTHVNGARIAAKGVDVWNPAFDVTPAHLITGGIITELGVFPAYEACEKVRHLLPQ